MKKDTTDGSTLSYHHDCSCNTDWFVDWNDLVDWTPRRFGDESRKKVFLILPATQNTWSKIHQNSVISVLHELCWFDAHPLLPFRRLFRICSKFEKILHNDTLSISPNPPHRDGSNLVIRRLPSCHSRHAAVSFEASNKQTNKDSVWTHRTQDSVGNCEFGWKWNHCKLKRAQLHRPSKCCHAHQTKENEW